MEEIVCAAGIAVAIGGDRIFSDVSFNISRGELMLVEGRNGSGKSSLLKLLAGLLTPGGGVLSVFGKSIYVPQRKAFFDSFTVAENLSLIGRVQVIDVARFKRLVARFDVEIHPEKPMSSYSGGERKMMALAAALAGRSDLLLLDEPLSALSDSSSEIAVAMLWEALNAGDRAIVVAEHKLFGLAKLKHIHLRL